MSNNNRKRTTPFGDPLEGMQPSDTEIPMPDFLEKRSPPPPRTAGEIHRDANIERAADKASSGQTSRSRENVPSQNQNRFLGKSPSWGELPLRQKLMRVGVSALVVLAIAVPYSQWMAYSNQQVDAAREQIDQARRDEQARQEQLAIDREQANQRWREETPEGQREQAIKDQQQELINRNGLNTP